MSRLPNLERALIEAAERREAAQHPAGRGRLGGARDRWRRMSRRGHGAGLLAGALVLGAVATGSAEVAGLGPFRALDRAADMDPGLETKADPAARLERHSPDGARRSWLVRAYVAENGQVCITGARAGARSGQLECHRTDAVAQAIVDPALPGATVADFAVVQGRAGRPRRLVVFGLAAKDAPVVTVRSGGRTYPTASAAGALRLTVDRSTGDLDAKGRRRAAAARLLASFPESLEVRLWAADVPVDSAKVRPGEGSGPIAVREEHPSAGGPAVVDVTDGFHVFGGDGKAAESWYRRTSLLDRGPTPVRAAAALQKTVVPAFDRPRTPADTVPQDRLDPSITRMAAQPGDSRRLRVGGTPGYGPVWAIPGATTWMNSRALGAICLVGPVPVSGCQIQLTGEPLPGLTSVMCSPELDPDLRLTFGLPPADATRARLTFERGRTETVAVQDLLMVVRPRTAGRLTRVTWIAPAGERSSGSWMPRRAARDICRPKPGRPHPSFSASGYGGRATIAR